MSAFQPDTSQGFPQLQDLQTLPGQSISEKALAGIYQSSEIPWQETLTMGLGGSKETLHLLPGLATPVVALTDAFSSFLHLCVNLFHITYIFPSHPLNYDRFISF